MVFAFFVFVFFLERKIFLKQNYCLYSRKRLITTKQPIFFIKSPYFYTVLIDIHTSLIFFFFFNIFSLYIEFKVINHMENLSFHDGAVFEN